MTNIQVQDRNNGSESFERSDDPAVAPVPEPEPEPVAPATIVIAGGGIVGLTLALALRKHLQLSPEHQPIEIYEKARQFQDDVGAALGMYPNGLRVLRDISPKLMNDVKDQGYPYLFRRFERHDGTEIATANEDALSTAAGDEELCSVGIRRWKLQKILYDAVLEAGIPIHFGKAICGVVEHRGHDSGHDKNGHDDDCDDGDDDLIEVQFEDGTSRYTRLLMGTDGGKSAVRTAVADTKTHQLKYVGVTCLMGISDCPSPRRGISFPSSTTSNYHAVYFPTGPNEQCFQIHFPIDEEHSDKSEWGNLSNAEGKVEFEKLAQEMESDGWHPRYIEPLYRVEHAVRVGFALLKPRLKRWVYGHNRRIILLGDAAHPPVPYVGQGAQMGVEDAGTLCLILKHLCFDEDTGRFNLNAVGEATKLFERIRIPRTSRVLDASMRLGRNQETRSMRADSTGAKARELFIRSEVAMKDTLPLMFPGAAYNYSVDVMEAITTVQQCRLGVGGIEGGSGGDFTKSSLFLTLTAGFPNDQELLQPTFGLPEASGAPNEYDHRKHPVFDEYYGDQEEKEGDRQEVAVATCRANKKPASWKDLLERTRTMRRRSNESGGCLRSSSHL